MIINVIPDWDDMGLTESDTADVEMRFNIMGIPTGDEKNYSLDLVEARAALLEQSPRTFGNLVRREIGLPNRLNKHTWSATVRYSLPDKGDRPEGDDTGWGWSFDTTGGSVHITQSLHTVSAYAAPGHTAPNFAGAIGVSSDSIEGVDKLVPNLSFSISRNFPFIIPSQFLVRLNNLTGKVNSTPFYGFAPGEILFEGASGNQSGVNPWNIQYKFKASPNAINITIGSIVIPFKRGWDYLWVRYADQIDTGSMNRVIKRPVAAYVEQIYEYVSFVGLGV